MYLNRRNIKLIVSVKLPDNAVLYKVTSTQSWAPLLWYSLNAVIALVNTDFTHCKKIKTCLDLLEIWQILNITYQRNK